MACALCPDATPRPIATSSLSRSSRRPIGGPVTGAVRSTVEKVLPADAAQTVIERWRSDYRRALKIPNNDKAVRAYLRSYADAPRTVGELATFMRATQLACFRRGRYLRVSLDILDREVSGGARQDLADPVVVEKLNRYGDPRAASAAIIRTLGMAPASMVDVTLNDVAEDGAWVRDRHRNRLIEVPLGVRRVLATHRLCVQAIGGESETQIVSATRSDFIMSRPVATKTVTSLVNTVSNDTGLRFGMRNERPTERGDATWARNHDISLHPLPSGAWE